MVGRRSSNLTPSLEEFDGWYNLSEPYDDGLPVLRSVELVPEFHHAEFFDLYFEAAKWFKQLVDTPASVPFDPFAEPGFFVRSDADDRTLAVEADFQQPRISTAQKRATLSSAESIGSVRVSGSTRQAVFQ